MKLLDRETQSIANAVSDVLEKKTVKEIKYPHKMYHPDTGEEVEVKSEEEHNKYTEKGWVHEKPAVKEVEEPRAKGEKDFKAKHAVKKSGMKNDGSNVKEEVTITIDEAKKAGYWSGAATISVTILYEMWKVVGFPGGYRWADFWAHEAVYGVMVWCSTMVLGILYRAAHKDA